MRSKLLLFLSLLATTAASAQTSLELKAQAEYTIQSALTMAFRDSAVHVHSGGRNSIASPSNLNYQYPLNGLYRADTTTTYFSNGLPGTRIMCKYNAQNLITETTSEFYNGTTWSNTNNKSVYTYNSAMLLHKIEVWYQGNPYTTETYSYSGGKMIEMKKHVWTQSLNAWTPASIDSFIANGTGSDSFHVYYTWNGPTTTEKRRDKYMRDAANRVISDSFFTSKVFSDATYCSYDAQGRLIKDSSELWKGSQAQMVWTDKRDYHYAANSDLTGVYRAYYWKATPPGSIILDSLTYNNYHQVTSYQRYEATTNGWIPFITSTSQFFYYGFPVNVPEVSTGNSFQLYPIPATSYINLSMQFTKPQAFSVRIFDMQGRLVSNWQEAAQKQYNKQIPLTNMAPGQYTVHILAGNESVSRQFMVVR